MFILCFWPFLQFGTQNTPNSTRFCSFAPFSGLERWHRAENSPFSTQKEKYISKPNLNIFCLFSPPSEPAAPSRTCAREGARQGWNLESRLSALLKQRPTLLQPAGFNRLTFQPKPICGESCSGSRPGTFQAEYSSTRQNADNELSPFREGNGAERDTPHYP